MILIFWILGMFMSFAMTACLYRKINLAKMLIVGSSIYFCIYTFVAGILVWINHFNILRTELLSIGIFGVVTFVSFLRNGKVLPEITLNVKKYIPLAILLIIFAFLSYKCTAGYLNCDQDEGLYQIRAMYYIGDQYDDYIDFDEYYGIQNPSEKQLYEKELYDMRGFYRLSETGEADSSSVIGVTHGVATFPALLALWGKMFGMPAMNGILTVMFLLVIANVYLICGNMNHKVFTRTVAAIFMGVCPIVMWSSKNVLTEIVVAMFFASFFELITETGKKKLGILAAVPMLASSYLHITTTVFMPMVVIVFVTSFIYTKHKTYLWGMMISLIGYATGFDMIMLRSKRYLINNLSNIFGMTKYAVNENNIEIIIWILVAIVCIVTLFIMYTPLAKKMTSSWRKTIKSKKACRIAGIIFTVITVFMIIFFIFKGIETAKATLWVMKLSVLCFLFMTGFIMLPLSFAGIVLLRKRIIQDRKRFIFTTTLIYTLFVYCGVVWISLYYYYYYARYFTPFMFIVIVCGAMLLDYFSWRIVAPLAAVCVAFVVGRTTLLYTEADNTYCSYENVESFASCIGQNDAVIILDQDMYFASVFALPINALTKADIYYAKPEMLEQVINSHKDAYDDVFIAMYNAGRLTEDDGIYRYVFKANMQTSVYDTFITEGMPYPKEATKFESPIALMIYQGN